MRILPRPGIRTISWYAIQTLCGKRTLILTANEQLKHNDLFIIKGQRYVIGTETTPLPGKNDVDILQTYYDHWFNVTDSVLEVTGLLGSIGIQPMPRAITQKAKDMDGVGSFIVL